MSIARLPVRSADNLTEGQRELRCHALVRRALDDHDSGRLPDDAWTSLHLCLALSVMAYRLFPVAELYLERARLPAEERPARAISLPERWPRLMEDLRAELGFPRHC